MVHKVPDGAEVSLVGGSIEWLAGAGPIPRIYGGLQLVTSCEQRAIDGHQFTQHRGQSAPETRRVNAHIARQATLNQINQRRRNLQPGAFHVANRHLMLP
jgi:hypothetical protein